MGRRRVYSGSGFQAVKSGAGLLYRGSKKRLKRITLRGNWSLDLWIFIVILALGLFILLPWLIRHPPPQHH